VRINPDKCIGCLMCLEYCPAGAIRENMNDPLSTVHVAEELCFECGLCQRLIICPEEAFEDSPDTAIFPRNARAYFSNPNTVHKLTLVPGRGTEESKTNDVTGRIKRGELGLCIEFGRPGLGCTFQDISLMTTRLKALGVQFEPNNPLTELMDPETGIFTAALLPQRLLSAIIEIKLSSYRDLDKIIPVIIDVSKKIDTVFSMSVLSRFEASGELPILEQLTRLGISYAPNAKINLGLGRPLIDL
jgi:NAD-dependent dihydropyrimidine dehydrogenase PreA subunit